MHMDDLLELAKNPAKELKAIGSNFKIGAIEELKANKVTVYTGLDIMWDAKNN